MGPERSWAHSNEQRPGGRIGAWTTQGAGLAYREEFNTLGEFFRKVGNLFRGKDKQREVE